MGIDVVDGGTTRTFFDHVDLVRQVTKHFPSSETFLDDVNLRKSVNDISVRLSEHEYVAPSSRKIPVGYNDVMPVSFGRIECMSRAPRAEPNDAASNERPKTKRRRKEPKKTPAPPRSPVRDAGTTYDVEGIGGDPYEMHSIAMSNTIWDNELVNYIIERGARPPLVAVTGGTTLSLFCTFRIPDGSLIHNVSIPRSVAAIVYGVS